MVYRPHCFDPKNKPEIIRQYKEVRQSKCPITGRGGPSYEGTFVEYTFINKKGRKVHVPEYCILVRWL